MLLRAHGMCDRRSYLEGQPAVLCNCYREANSAEANEGVEATYMEADGVVPD